MGMIKDISFPPPGDAADNASAGARTPILWALLALAYLFEIGAVAVVISATGNIQTNAAWAAMIFPLAAMTGVSLIRLFGESFFYLSTRRLEDISAANLHSLTSEAAEKVVNEIETGVKR